MALGGILGGLANLGTVYGGYQQAQATDISNQMRQLALQNALQQQQAQNASWGIAEQGLNRYFPGMSGLPTTPQPSPLPTTPFSPQPLPTTPQAAPAPSPLPTTPNIPGATYAGGGFGVLDAGTPVQQPTSYAGAAGIPGLPGSPSGPGMSPPQLAGLDGNLPGPPSGATVNTLLSTLSLPPTLRGQAGQAPPGTSRYDQAVIASGQVPTPQGQAQPPGQPGAAPGQATPYAPAPPPQQTAQVPGTADTGGTAQVPGTADTGTAAQAPSGSVAAQVTQILKQRGWSDAAIQGALANGMAESGLKPWGETGAAGEQGIWQFNPSGELPAYQKQYGSSRSVADQTNFMADRVEASIPGYAKIGSATAATDQFMSGFEKPSNAQPGSRYRFLGQTGGADAVTSARIDGHNIWAASTSPQEKQGSSIGTMSILQRYPQLGQMTGTFDMDKLVQTIDQTYPNASPGVKLGIFNNMFNLLEPIAKEQYAKTIELVKADIQEQDVQARDRETAAYRAAELDIQRTNIGLRTEKPEEEPLGGPVQTPEGSWVQPMRKGPPQPLPGTPASAANLQARADTDPRKSAFEAYKTEYAAAHGGKQPSADEQAAYMRKLYPSRSAPGMALSSFIEQFQQENGRPPNADEIRQFQAEGFAMGSEARAIGTAGANVDIQANKAEALIPLLKEKSHQIDRTNYPDINSLVLAYETKTGDPTVVQYGELVNALRYTYAGIMARGGQPRVADIQHFDEIFNKAWSSDQVDSALEQMQTTINRERDAILKTRKQVGVPTGQRGEGGSSSPSAVPTATIKTMTRDQLQRYGQSLSPEQRANPELQQAVEERLNELDKLGE